MSHVQFSFLLLCPILLSHVPCPISHSTALRNRSASSASTSVVVAAEPDWRVLVAFERYMGHLESGTLVHGPLLGWARVMGDELTKFRFEAGATEYLMPLRLGVAFKDYPWNQHGTAPIE